jgi:hypothetical protein
VREEPRHGVVEGAVGDREADAVLGRYGGLGEGDGGEAAARGICSGEAMLGCNAESRTLGQLSWRGHSLD